jgi:hypothetical protein
MIDGLKLTFSGEELRTLLGKGVRGHEDKARRWTRETLREKDDETDDAPLLPQHICENEIERHTWRATTLAFIRDHIDAAETYRLGAADLEFGELLPEKPRWLEHDEYEERTRVGFNLKRLARSVDALVGVTAALPGRGSRGAHFGTFEESVIEDTAEFRTTRIDVEDGPEIVKIERK